jgi:hypothetical protein
MKVFEIPFAEANLSRCQVSHSATVIPSVPNAGNLTQSRSTGLFELESLSIRDIPIPNVFERNSETVGALELSEFHFRSVDDYNPALNVGSGAVISIENAHPEFRPSDSLVFDSVSTPALSASDCDSFDVQQSRPILTLESNSVPNLVSKPPKLIVSNSISGDAVLKSNPYSVTSFAVEAPPIPQPFVKSPDLFESAFFQSTFLTTRSISTSKNAILFSFLIPVRLFLPPQFVHTKARPRPILIPGNMFSLYANRQSLFLWQASVHWTSFRLLRSPQSDLVLPVRPFLFLSSPQ